MGKFTKVSFIALWLIAGVLQSPAYSQDGTLDTIKKRGTVLAGVRNDFPPLGFTSQQGDWVGYDLELAQYVATKLGVKLEKVLITPATRVPMLVNGNVDFIMLTNPTRERAKVVDFTNPYFIGGQGIMAKKESGIKSVADLSAPRKTGTVQGSQDGPSVMIFQPKAELVYFQDYPQAVLALKQGRIDALSTTDITLRRFAKEDPSFVLLPPFKPDPLVFGVRQNDSKWRLFLEQTLMDAWCDGTIPRLFEKYVGGEINFQITLWPDYYGNCKYIQTR